jgi:hypothetical protein
MNTTAATALILALSASTAASIRVEVRWDGSPAMQEFAVSSAGSLFICENIVGVVSDFQIDIDFTGVTTANASFANDCNGDHPGDFYAAFARTSPPIGTGLILELEVGLSKFGLSNFADSQFNFVTASANISIVPESEPRGSISLTADITATNFTASADVRYIGAVIDGDFVGITSSPNGTSSQSLSTTDDINWKGSVPIASEATGTFLIAANGIDASDNTLDVDGDGRFTSSDSIALEALIGSSDAAFVQRFDFDDSGDISQGDVDTLALFANAGLGAGVFGDSDNNGDIDCNDLNQLQSLLPSTPLDDSNYNIRLDYDLDGLIDMDDEAELLAIYEPLLGDTNDDLLVNFADLNAVLDAYGSTPGSPNWNPGADFNNDNIVSFADLNTVNAQFGQSCE